MKSVFCKRVGLLKLGWFVAVTSGVTSWAGDPPTKERQDQVITMLREAGYLPVGKSTDAQKRQIVQRLMKLHSDQTTSIDEMYMIDRAMMNLSRSLDIGPAIERAIEHFAQNFSKDGNQALTYKMETLVSYFEDVTKRSQKLPGEVSKYALETATQLSQANRFDDAIQLIESLKKASTTVVSKQLEQLQKPMVERKTAFETYTAAKAKLAKEPMDTKANLIVGRWLATQEGKWDEALDYLIGSKVGPWANVANLERTSEENKQSLLEIADNWSNLSQQNGESSELEKRAIKQRARDLYTNVRLKFASQLSETEQKRIAKALGEKYMRKSSQDATKDDRFIPTNQPVDLLAMIDINKHVIRGSWGRQEGLIRADEYLDSVLLVPISIVGSYEVRCEFVRQTSNKEMSISLPLQYSNVNLFAGIPQSETMEWSGLGIVDKKGVGQELVSINAAAQTPRIQNGQRNTLICRVRQESGTVRIEAQLNGQPVANWTGEERRLVGCSWATPPAIHAMGIFCQESAYDFKKLELIPLKGSLACCLDEEWGSPMFKVAAAPPPNLVCSLDDRGKKYFLSDGPMSWTEARTLARRYNGRLLSISSKEEFDFLKANLIGGYTYHMDGWCNDSWQFRNERNKILDPIFWKHGQPRWAKEFNLFLAAAQQDFGVQDAHVVLSCRACIEWGEE